VLVEWIRGRGGEATARDLMRSRWQIKTSDEANAALQKLVDRGAGKWIERQPSPAGGRPTRVFKLFDATDIDNTSRGDIAGEGSVNVSNVDALGCSPAGDDTPEAAKLVADAEPPPSLLDDGPSENQRYIERM